MNPQFKSGFSFVEVVVISALIGLLAMLVIPRMYVSTNSLNIETFSKEVVSTFQLVQLQSKSLQQPLTVSINYTDEEDVDSFSFSYPASKLGILHQEVLTIPDMIAVTSNAFIDQIVFYPDLSWEAYYLLQLQSLDTVLFSFSSGYLTKAMTLYKYSGSIQLE